jgi:transposase
VVRRWHDHSGSPLCCRWRKKNNPQEPADHALGRSRGGFSTKIHLLCDGHGYPLEARLTAGQDHESTAFEELLDQANQTVTDLTGEPIAWPAALAGDKGYRANWVDEFLAQLDIKPVIPSKANEDPTTRPVEFDKTLYRRRSIIEQLIGWLKENRRILSRFEKTAINYLGMLKAAFIQRYLRLMCR